MIEVDPNRKLIETSPVTDQDHSDVQSTRLSLSDSYDIAQTLSQIQAREQRLKREMEYFKTAKLQLEDELKAEKEKSAAFESQLITLRQKQTLIDPEKNRLQGLLNQLHSKYDHMVRNYGELYQYCDSLWGEAEKVKTDLDAKYKDVFAKKAWLEQRLFTAEGEVSSYKKANEELERSKLALEKSLSELTLKDARQFASSIEHERTESKLRRAVEILEIWKNNIARASNYLARTGQTLDAISTSLRKLSENLDRKSLSPITQKSAQVLLDQMQTEIDNVKRVSAFLNRR